MHSLMQPPCVLRHRLEPEDGRVLHMAGQSPAEFAGYAQYLGPEKRPLAYTTYHSLPDCLS